MKQNYYYHKFGQDDYPEGDPYGLMPSAVLNSLKEKNIQYYFGEINISTNLMIEEFNKEVGSSYIQKTSMNQHNMIDILTKSNATFFIIFIIFNIFQVYLLS